MTTLDEQLRYAVKQMVHYRGLYEVVKRHRKHLALWLEAERRLIKEKGAEDFDRLLEILDEIEGEGKEEWSLCALEEKDNVTPT